MICDRCKKNPATVHVESIMNGVRTEHNLCFECAATINAEMSVENIIKEFLSSVIDHTGAFGGNDKPETGPVCPRCGLKYE
ncbi:MAG: excinuclease ABC subunit B, partial [Clostridiales bacterium]|nr:excinuclease ABC subunit B [Clostridiales bacterium]